MWKVRNLLRGTLTFRGLGISIPPKGEVDLDALLGRERAERSNQVLVAFEEGYLQTVLKPSGDGAPAMDGGALEARLAAFKESLSEELGVLRTSLAGDVRDMLANLKVARAKLHEEKERILVDATLSDAEVRARLAYLDEKEQELEKNFSELGRKKSGSPVGGSVVANADLLSSI
jgi:hypothetical protein